MKKVIFFLINIFLFVSISFSQQNKTNGTNEQLIIKDTKQSYIERQTLEREKYKRFFPKGSNMKEYRNYIRKYGDIPPENLEANQVEDLDYNRISTPNNRSITLNEEATIKAIISDFQVNENVGGCNQWSPSIAMDGSGNFVIAWEDERNDNSDIYAQRYNSNGTAEGTNFKVNDDAGSSSQYVPTIAIDVSGNFVIAWGDYRYGNPDIYAQMYISRGTAVGTNFKVNDDEGSSYQWNPSIAIDGSGNFVIAWEDERNEGNWTRDIYAQMYISSGTAVGTNFKVNDDAGSSYQWEPSIAIDGSGNFVIAWQDGRNGNYDIFAQRYNSSGISVGTNFKVNDDAGSSDQWFPSIAIDGSGNFIIAWEDKRNDYGDIYAQRYNSSGTANGTNFKVNDDVMNSYQSHPSIVIDGTGNFVIAWGDYRYGIYAQRYNSSGTVEGTNFKVNDDAGSSSQYDPTIAIDGTGNFVIAWADFRNGNYNIYAQMYNSSGTAKGTNFKVNDDAGSSFQLYPSVAIDGSGNFVIAWIDKRNGDFDIYAQRYNSSGTAVGTNFKVNDDAGSSYQWEPSIAIDGSGNFVIAWHDERNDYYGDIYAQRYNSSGTAEGTNFKVNDDAGSSSQYDPTIAIDGTGNFVIAWADYRNDAYHPNIYAQRYNSSGTAVGTNFKVNDDAGSSYQWNPSIAMNGSGNFVIDWVALRNYNYYIYAQRYNSSGTAVGTNFKVNDDAGSSYQWEPSIAIDGSGNFVIAWGDYRYGNYDIYAQMYNSSGASVGTNFKVNDDGGSSSQYDPTIAIDATGNFVIAWADERNDHPDIYAQRYNSSGVEIGNNFRVTIISDKEQISPDVKLWNGRIYNVWQSNHNEGTGYDIWANVLDWDNPVSVESEMNGLPTNYELLQNYPNPFNPSTNIKFALPERARVNLSIYNILGERVAEIINEELDAGYYEKQWNASGFASGVYLYRIIAGSFVETKKLLLLK